ncbi:MULTISPECIES: SapB/AmfS family lanthipeptide [unclassified Lentzea]
MGFILDMQELEIPEATNAVLEGGHGGGAVSNASLLLPCSQSTVSLLAC